MRIGSASCAALIVLLTFQALSAEALPPSTGAGEYNHALTSNGGVASASGSSSAAFGPAKANDGLSSTYWESSTTTGWLEITFGRKVRIDEIHAHFTTTVYKTLSLYLETTGDATYEPKVWSTISNGGLSITIPLTPTDAYRMKITIDAKVGSAKPRINEFEAYLRYDTDGDGLTNAQEAATVYYQDMQAGGMPQPIADDPQLSTSSAVSLVQFYGTPVRALVNFTVDHSKRADITAAVGYWNGTGWVDRYVWDPGKKLLSIGITEPLGGHVDGAVPVVAYVANPDITSKVEFRVDGVLLADVTTPIGHEYRWTWDTSGYAEGSHTLNARQVDILGGYASDTETVTVNRPPSVSWVAPAEGAVLSSTVTLTARATDGQGIARVAFYADNEFIAEDTVPSADTNDYSVLWDTSGSENGPHVVKAVAVDASPPSKSASVTRSVTTSNDPFVRIIDPTPAQELSGVYLVKANASSPSTISRVEFYVDSVLKATDTTGPSPYTWSWDTRLTENGVPTLMAKAYSASGNTASHAILVIVENLCDPSCPMGPAAESLPAVGSSTGTRTLGVLGAEWTLGEEFTFPEVTIVVDLVEPQSTASASENASRILRPAFPITAFTTYLQWRLVIRDAAPSALACLPEGATQCTWTYVPGPSQGNVIAAIFRFEATSDSTKPDSDGDSLRDRDEVATWGTLPVTRDSDLDGLTEDYEIAPHTLTVWVGGTSLILTAFTTNPTDWDTDDDGLSDGQERGNVTTGQSKVVGEVGHIDGVTGSCTAPRPRRSF